MTAVQTGLLWPGGLLKTASPLPLAVLSKDNIAIDHGGNSPSTAVITTSFPADGNRRLILLEGRFTSVACQETESCFQASGSYSGSIILFSKVPSSRFELCMKQGREEVDDVDRRRGGRQHKGRNESGSLICKPLSIFDQFFAPRRLKQRDHAWWDLESLLWCLVISKHQK